MFGQGGQGTSAALAQLGWAGSSPLAPARGMDEQVAFAAPSMPIGPQSSPFQEGLNRFGIGEPRFGLNAVRNDFAQNRFDVEQSLAKYQNELDQTAAKYAGGTGTATGTSDRWEAIGRTSTNSIATFSERQRRQGSIRTRSKRL
jgi:hypothetical protein